EVLAGRIANATDRPLLAGDARDRLQELAMYRVPLYAEAHVHIDAATHPEIVTSAVLQALGQLPVPDPIWVQTPSQTYPVYVGSRIIAQLGRLARVHGLDASLRVIADERVLNLHGSAVREALAGCTTTWYPVAAGEEHKTLATVLELYDRILADRPERGDV